jgi:hypothetical protein
VKNKINTGQEKKKLIVFAKPVVMSQGLWNNLFSWEDFGFELARGEDSNNPRNTWLIEITGGPNTECDTCPNYDYDDLKTYYWPALISGVEAYTGENQIDYVGFSNGCRVALSSLEDYQNYGKNNAGYYVNSEGEWELTDLSADVVDTFVGVGCPGAFEGDSLLGGCIIEYGDEVLDYFDGINHINQDELARALSTIAPMYDLKCHYLTYFLNSENKISYELTANYFDWIKSDLDSQPGNGLDFNNFYMHYGDQCLILPGENDCIVTGEDELAIYAHIEVTGSNDIFNYPLMHNSLADYNFIQYRIKEELN